ncbi:2Fe-2S iron-sulfur cluster-binding protein [Williamsia serinedens]|jgi:2Fe-2S ferredoxin|uniref:Ferredoxin, 2Fe-2S n=1 Tax=Williamsia serinedens TaxID=391736 RepID=A0ABT1H3I3_9NOCA|nr:2Fe-2S iron-sulfur cluster-binding protein [Williamsia serinedens]MCP2161792.1 ferredoxin, 2Fe-2S [Williamsia serinedens]
MATITYVTHDGEDYPAPVTPGRSLMQIAVDEAIPGIDGDCGGEAACGTCHVVVDSAWIDTVGHSTDVEEGMLSMHPEREANSRLACQMTASNEWDGLTVRLPEFQL